MIDYSKVSDDELAGKIIKLRQQMPKNKHFNRQPELDEMVAEYTKRGEEDILVLAYGTLNEAPVMKYLWGRVKLGMDCVLPGYKKCTYASGIHYIVPDTESEVFGKLYKLTARELDRTDSYEGLAYRRVRAQAKSIVSGVIYGCWVYAQAIKTESSNTNQLAESTQDGR